MLKIFFKKSFQKSLLKFPLSEQKKVLKKIDALKKEQKNLDIKKLHPKEKNWYRLRVGKYRVLFKQDKQGIILLEIDSRDRIYFYIS